MNSPDLRKLLWPLALAVSGLLADSASAAVYVQCPGDTNGDAIPDSPSPGIVCKHLAAGDGFSSMADGKPLYGFGFSDFGAPAQADQHRLLLPTFAPTIGSGGDKFTSPSPMSW
jgi:hypothetical protein